LHGACQEQIVKAVGAARVISEVTAVCLADRGVRVRWYTAGQLV